MDAIQKVQEFMDKALIHNAYELKMLDWRTKKRSTQTIKTV